MSKNTQGLGHTHPGDEQAKGAELQKPSTADLSFGSFISNLLTDKIPDVLVYSIEDGGFIEREAALVGLLSECVNAGVNFTPTAQNGVLCWAIGDASGILNPRDPIQVTNTSVAKICNSVMRENIRTVMLGTPEEVKASFGRKFSRDFLLAASSFDVGAVISSAPDRLNDIARHFISNFIVDPRVHSNKVTESLRPLIAARTLIFNHTEWDASVFQRMTTKLDMDRLHSMVQSAAAQTIRNLSRKILIKPTEQMLVQGHKGHPILSSYVSSSRKPISAPKIDSATLQHRLLALMDPNENVGRVRANLGILKVFDDAPAKDGELWASPSELICPEDIPNFGAILGWDLKDLRALPLLLDTDMSLESATVLIGCFNEMYPGLFSLQESERASVLWNGCKEFASTVSKSILDDSSPADVSAEAVEMELRIHCEMISTRLNEALAYQLSAANQAGLAHYPEASGLEDPDSLTGPQI